MTVFSKYLNAKAVLIFTFCCLSIGASIAQSVKDRMALKADSLILTLSTYAQNSKEVPEILLEIAWLKRELGQLKDAITYAHKAKKTAEALNLKTVVSQAYVLLTDGYNSLHLLDSSNFMGKEHLQFVNQAIDLAPEIDYGLINMQFDALKWWAHADWQHYKIDEAYKKMEEARDIIRSMNLNEALAVNPNFRYGHIFELYAMMKEWDNEISQAIHAAEEYRIEAEITGDTKQLNTSKYWLGWIKFQQKDYQEALKILKSVSVDSLDRKSLIRPWNVYRTIGQVFGKLGANDSLRYYANMGTVEVLLTEDYCQISNVYYRNIDDAIELGDWKWAFASSYGVSEYDGYIDKRDISRLEAQMLSERREMILDNQIANARNRNRLITAIAIIFFVFALFLYARLRLNGKTRKFELIAKEKLEAEKEMELIKRDRLNSLLDHKKRQLTTITISSERMNSLISEFKSQLSELKTGLNCPEKLKSINEMLRRIKTTNQSQSGWAQFYKHFESVHPDFFSKLLKVNEDLTQNELRHSAYVLMSLSNKEVANMYGIGHESVKKARWRLKTRLKLTAEESLQDFMYKISNSNSYADKVRV